LGATIATKTASKSALNLGNNKKVLIAGDNCQIWLNSYARNKKKQATDIFGKERTKNQRICSEFAEETLP